jgi:hypothetical protein
MLSQTPFTFTKFVSSTKHVQKTLFKNKHPCLKELMGDENWDQSVMQGGVSQF